LDFERSYFDDVYGGDYDRRNPRYKMRRLLRTVMRFEDGGRMLDVGCAYGAYLAEAAASGRFELAGTDISEHAVDVARQRLPDAVDLRPGGLFDADFEPGSFDAVCMFDVIEHIEDLEAAYARVRELLRPRGLFAMSVPVYDGPLGPLVQALDKDPTHLHKWPRGDWIDATARNGFDVMHWAGLFRYFLAGRRYLFWDTLVGRSFCPAILVLARPR